MGEGGGKWKPGLLKAEEGERNLRVDSWWSGSDIGAEKFDCIDCRFSFPSNFFNKPLTFVGGGGNDV